MNHPQRFDVIVIGGGHAGAEAALASARVGARTLLLTMSIETIGQMSCNPAIGGIGKSHLVREIDALGGAMAIAADRAGIHFRTLNSSKGPAVRATRAQADRVLYRNAMRAIVEAQANLTVFQQSVVDLVVDGDRIRGVDTQMGLRFEADRVVLTTGTFLGGRIHIGLQNGPGGRAGDAPANALAERLRALPLRVDRLKTVNASTLGWAQRGFRRDGDAIRGRAPTGDVLSVHAGCASGADRLPHHAHQHDHPRHHPGWSRPLADVRRRDRGRGSAVLSVDRGQGRALR